MILFLKSWWIGAFLALIIGLLSLFLLFSYKSLVILPQ